MRFLPLSLRWLLASVASLAALGAGNLLAHPIPDIPVKSYFNEGGKARLTIEINPRCFDKDPTSAPSILKSELEAMSPEERAAMQRQAVEYAESRVAFFLEPLGRVKPEFTFEFTTRGGTALTEDEGVEVVVLAGSWDTVIPAGISGYRIKALPAGNLSVQFLNEVGGKAVERMQILFPGEDSYVLDLSGLASSEKAVRGADSVSVEDSGWWPSFVTYLRDGFVHVLPLGLDHILFVLGLFLLSRSLWPLVLQITTFTVAHTITLGMATVGWVSAPDSVVEPVIALSITVVALENIFRPKYTHWRLLVVFVFGLIHGLGFAGALSERGLPTSSLLVGLLGFNIGVEFGQLAVIALALLATFWIRNPKIYRRAVVIPGSLVIAAMGLWWFFERTFG